MNKRNVVLSVLTRTDESDDVVFSAIVGKLGARRVAELLYIPPDKNLFRNPGPGSSLAVRQHMESEISRIESEIRNMCDPQS